MPTPYSTQLEFAKELVKKGGLIAKNAQQNHALDYTLKPNEKAHLVTKYDTQIEEMMIKAIKREFPGHAIYGEETGNHSGTNGFTWLIDPIDGTSNFAHGLPLYCTMLALMHGGEVVVAAIYLPVLDELFYGEAGQGSFVNGKRLSVSKEESLERAFVYVERGGKEHDKWYVNLLSNSQSKVMGTRILGSCGIQMAFIAAGRMDGFISKGTNLYDRAPGVLFIKEAGGVIVNFKGEEYDVQDKDLVAANPSLAQKIVSDLPLDA